ncbi:MAG TPA: FAD-dependent oxidoreductase [Solirubrobacteraceae bacterium]|nr:FAD-dependent oxidoreductase [Solirubrobacteraceae bacterium]
MRTGEGGFWWRTAPARPSRASLPGPLEADVAIVGAGFTGLWTAYYLKRADPSLHVVVLEAERAGYGASGRNGGWATGFFAGTPRVYGDGFMELQRAMFATVDEIAEVLAREGIEADFVKHGHLTVARGAAQEQRLREQLRELRASGLGEADVRELAPSELSERVLVQGSRLATFSPHAARLHPAKLVAGLAATAERLGVSIYERTRVRELRRHEAVTSAGPVRARWVVRATEGYTASLRGMRRALAPLNSSMIVTEPLPEEAWDRIGWRGAEVLDDAAHVFVYLQRTADGRIAIGGRGVPYRLGSRTDRDGATARATVRHLRAQLVRMFPAAQGAAIDHAWSGVLGVARDWRVSVGADRACGSAWAGSYVGEGVAASNLAARTLRDLLLGADTRLAWVAGAPARGWEPEPLRFLGIRGVYALYRGADAIERRSGAPSRLARFADRLSGRR